MKLLPFLITSKNAEKWVEIMHFRILNHDEYRRLFSEVLKEVNVQVQETLVNLINDIKNEDPVKFRDIVEEVKTTLYNKRVQ